MNITIISTINGIGNQTEAVDIKVYPNPTKDNLNVNMNGLRNDIILELTDINGKIIQNLKVEANQDNILKTLDLSNVARGVYLLNIKDRENSKTVRVVKY